MPFSGPNRGSRKKCLILGNFLLTDSLKSGINLKACSRGGVVEDFFFLPTVRSFTRKLGKSILATPSKFSVDIRFICRTSMNGGEVNLWIGLDAVSELYPYEWVKANNYSLLWLGTVGSWRTFCRINGLKGGGYGGNRRQKKWPVSISHQTNISPARRNPDVNSARPDTRSFHYIAEEEKMQIWR